MTHNFNESIWLSTEVRNALEEKKPVVALESTIITHGMPWPENLSTAIEVEHEVRSSGAIPATIAVIKGQLSIGLDHDQLEQLANTTEVMKLSRADLAACIALGKYGSTTVAATMIAANLAGISVFATGGIGGVHRDVGRSFDISADLNELARTNVNVVCAGPKAILDIAKTMEYLETAGVPVIAWRSDELPAFWSRSSGLSAPLRFDDIAALTQFISVRKKMGIGGGTLITNPVPADQEIPASDIEQYIEQALTSASTLGISGKQITPFLLDDIFKRTDGRSLNTNVALIKNNARLAARLALSLATIRSAPTATQSDTGTGDAQQ